MRCNQHWHAFRDNSNRLCLWVRVRETDAEKVRWKMSMWSNGSAGVTALKVCVRARTYFFIYCFKMVEGHGWWPGTGSCGSICHPEQCCSKSLSITSSFFVTLSRGFLTYISYACTSWSIFKAAVTLRSILIQKESWKALCSISQSDSWTQNNKLSAYAASFVWYLSSELIIFNHEMTFDNLWKKRLLHPLSRTVYQCQLSP